MALKELVAVRLREARKIKGWSQSRAADSIKVKQTTWSSWESGQNSIPLEMLEYAAHALGQPIEFFMLADYQYTVKASIPESLKKGRTERQGKKQAAPS